MSFESQEVQSAEEGHQPHGFITLFEFVRKHINASGAKINEEDIRGAVKLLREKDPQTYDTHVRARGKRLYYDYFALKAGLQHYIDTARAKENVGPYRDQRLKLLQKIHDAL